MGPLCSRGVPARPKAPKIPHGELWFERLAEGAEYAAERLVYTDGSATGWHWRGCRAAYGAVCYGEGGAAKWMMRGVCGGPHANIVEAELRAVLEVLRIVTGPTTIKVDNAYVVRGFQKGKAWTVRAGADAAGTWREVWSKMKEVGQWVKIAKVKAHRAWWEVMGGPISYMDYQGNKAADKAAKEALKVGLLKAPTGEFNAAIARAVTWARWAIKYAAAWGEKVEEEEAEGEEGMRRAEVDEIKEERKEERRTLPHDLWRRQTQLLCRRCGRTGTEKAKCPLKTDTCNGCVAGRVLAANTSNTNHTWATYKWSVAELVASGYAQLKPVMIPGAAIDEEGLSAVQGTDAAAWATISSHHEEEEAREKREGTEAAHEDTAILRPCSASEAHNTAEGMHAIRTRGGLVWCDVCGAYGVERSGSRLMGKCQPKSTRHAATRLERLRQGKHPITALALT